MSICAPSETVSSLGDAELLDALRAKEIHRRRLYAEQLELIAEIDARGIRDERGCVFRW